MTASYEPVFHENDCVLLKSLAPERDYSDSLHLASPISIKDRLIHSASFDSLFQDAMQLIEQVSRYLDGPGREEAHYLDPEEMAVYTSESVRLTTCLMQIAAWLFLRRAVNEGELTQEEAESNTHRVRLSVLESKYDAETRALLPSDLNIFIVQTARLHMRITHLDVLLYPQEEIFIDAMRPSGLEAQWDLLRAAFH